MTQHYCLRGAHYQVLTFVGCHSLNSALVSPSVCKSRWKKKSCHKNTSFYSSREEEAALSFSAASACNVCAGAWTCTYLCVCWILNWRCGNSYVNDTQTHTVSCSITQRLLISSPWFISFTAAARPYVQLFFSFNKWTELPAVRFNHVVGEQKDEKIEKNKEGAQDERNM